MKKIKSGLTYYDFIDYCSEVENSILGCNGVVEVLCSDLDDLVAFNGVYRREYFGIDKFDKCVVKKDLFYDKEYCDIFGCDIWNIFEQV